MKWFLNLKTAHKLGLSFGICLALSLVMGLTAIARMGQMNNSANLLYTDTVKGLEGIRNCVDDIKQYHIIQFLHILESDNAQRDTLEGQIKDKAAEIDKDFSDYERTTTQDEDRTNLQELKKRWSSYTGLAPTIMASVRKNDIKNANAILRGEATRRFDAISNQIEVMSDWNVTHGEKLRKQAESTYGAARTTTIGLLVLAIGFGISAAVIVTRIITSALFQVSSRLDALLGSCATNLRTAMDAMAQGNMTVSIIPTTQPLDIDSKDEFGDLARTFNALLDKLKGAVFAYGTAQEALSHLLAQARVAADTIAQSSREVSTGNQDLSQRTEEQASSLEETASSMEEMTSTVKQNANNSRQANLLATQAKDAAQQGGSVVSRAVSAMAEINAGSKRIADIIGVIDEIAFQTNLLALNAAVEAARVGEQGRGFAVVAAEVRSLAGRSASAAKEIKALVQDTVVKVEEGSVLVNQSGAQLGEIVGSVTKVADIIAEISAASQEQSAGIEQVNKAVMQMDQVTQQNAALVEEASAAAASMAQQAQELNSLVARFKVEDRYIRDLQQVQVAANAAPALATGTTGRAPRSASYRPTARLRLLQNEESAFEEF